MYMTNPRTLDLPPELKSPQVVESPEGSGTFVRLGDSYLEAIVYLGWPTDNETEIQPTGTGFLLRCDNSYYIVTAAHVAADLDCPFGVRVTVDSGGAGRVVKVEYPKWFFHPDDKVDVAVLPFDPPPWAKNRALNTHDLIQDQSRTYRVGPGDLVYVVGVFKLLPGQHKNNPVVHVGHLASWAEGEGVPVQDWRKGKSGKNLRVKAHIVQVPTLRMASGSPVFVRPTVEIHSLDTTWAARRGEYEGEPPRAKAGPAYAKDVSLLGLWHGAWLHPDADEAGIELPLGMGIVIPAHHITETLFQPDLENMRVEKGKREERARTVRPQSGKPLASDADTAEYERVVRNLLATPPKPRTAKRTPAKKGKSR